MAKIKATEREFGGQVIHWIKERLKEGGLPFENATNDSSLYGLPTVEFPDVLLTLDFECLRPFCGWELKTPKTDARDKGFLKNAIAKAQTIRAKYFVTWNMQTAIIWRTPEKTRTIVNESDKVREFGPDSRISDVMDIRDMAKAEVLHDVCKRLLEDLGRLHEDENINIPVTDSTIFVNVVGNASEKMAGMLLNDIKKTVADKSFNKRLEAWAKKQGVNKYDQDYWQTLAQQVAYKIIAKALFYLTLRRQNLNLPKLDLKGENYQAAMKRMRHLFQLGLEVDYQAVFEPDITDEIELGEDTAKVIIELCDNLTHWSFELMPLDVIGAVFEKLVPEDARHSLGQYFTPDNLVDLIVTFCVRNRDDCVMDPTCGTGTFLIRSYNCLRHLGSRAKPHRKLLEQVWGFDIAGFPAELATINLYRQDLNDYLNFPRVLSKDFFNVLPGSEFEFPPPKKTSKTQERIKVQIPKFDALVGNFPFIRQELIEKVNKGYKKVLERVLFESWGKEYKELFRDENNNNSQKLRLSGQADIYAYMFFHAAAHAKFGARLGFVTSNSWLDVAYGYELQKFFLSKFKIIAVCESRCEPWFEQSAVNTVFTVLERCNNEDAKKDNPVRFVKIKKPLKELFPQDALTDAQARWIRLEQFVSKIEGIAATGEIADGADCKKFDRISAEYVRQPQIISYEDDEVRIRIIRQSDLKDDVEHASQTVKWGQYLRAPDVYFEILQKCADKLVPLKKVAKIRRGITTGINEFFYLAEDKIKHWGIEEEFLKPVVTSTREISGVFVDKKKLSMMVFSCHKDKKQLRGTGALKYIKYGENRKTANGIPWPEVPSVKGRKYWYSVPENVLADFLVLRFRDRRHYTPINKERTAVGDVVFVGEIREPTYKEFYCAFLNSALTALFAEVFGRANLGDGLLTTYGPEIEMLLVPTGLTGTEAEKKMVEVDINFKRLSRRKAFPFNKEMRQGDRTLLEESILRFLGLGEVEYKEICEAVSELINERHILPKLRSLRKKKRIEQDIEKLKEDVTDEVLPNGVIKFPDGFVKGWGRIDCKEICVPAVIVKMGEGGIGVWEICDNEGQHLMEVGSEEEAKFIVYAKTTSIFVIKIPKSSVVVKKAVQDYEFYVREKREELYKGFIEKSGDHALSENLTWQVLEEYGLPDVK